MTHFITTKDMKKLNFEFGFIIHYFLKRDINGKIVKFKIYEYLYKENDNVKELSDVIKKSILVANWGLTKKLRPSNKELKERASFILNKIEDIKLEMDTQNLKHPNI